MCFSQFHETEIIMKTSKPNSTLLCVYVCLILSKMKSRSSESLKKTNRACFLET